MKRPITPICGVEHMNFTVKEVMVTEFKTIRPEALVKEAARVIFS